MPKTIDPEALAVLDAWADKVAVREPDIAAGLAAYAACLAADRRLAKHDREFAAAQAEAIWRALRRAKANTLATSLAKTCLNTNDGLTIDG